MTTEDLKGGLQRFVERWNKAGATVLSRRLEGALDCDFLCRGPGESYVLRLTRNEAKLTPGNGMVPHAALVMGSDDWRNVLSGRWSVMSIVLAGRAPFPKHQRRFLMQFSMLMQTVLLLES
jgi:hypothetical protein